MKPISVFGTLGLMLALVGVLAGRGFAAPIPMHAPSAAAAAPELVTCGAWGNGRAMLGDWDRMSSGMMGNASNPGTQGLVGGMWGMMGSLGMLGFDPADATPIPTGDAQRRLATFAASCGPEIHVAAVTPFANDLYAQLSDAAGTRLGEVLVDRYTGTVVPEPGPNLLWNTRWGVAAGTISAPRYAEPAAQRLAEQFMAGYLPGAAVLSAAALPGYDTFAYGRGQTIEGLLSVNAMTGAIWVHAWLGPALDAQP